MSVTLSVTLTLTFSSMARVKLLPTMVMGIDMKITPQRIASTWLGLGLGVGVGVGLALGLVLRLGLG